MAPVTTATVETSNLALAYTKIELRSTMKESRLNDLLMLFVHKDIRVYYVAVILTHPRRMVLDDPFHAEDDCNS